MVTATAAAREGPLPIRRWLGFQRNNVSLTADLRQVLVTDSLLPTQSELLRRNRPFLPLSGFEIPNVRLHGGS